MWLVMSAAAEGRRSAVTNDAEDARHAAADVLKEVRSVVERLRVVLDQEREQVRRRKCRAKPFKVVSDVNRGRCAIVHPRHVCVAQHAVVQPVAAARHVLDDKSWIALAQPREHLV